MSKIGKLKLELAKLLASFAEIKTDKAVLTYPSDEELQVGFDVYVVNENGEYIAPEDGEYKTEDGKIITLVNGRVDKITEVEVEIETEPESEPEVEETVEVVAEEPVDPVVETDGDKESETDAIDGIHREINELYAVVDSLVKEVASIKETVEKMGKMSAAMSAQEEIEQINTNKTTGDTSLDKKLKRFIG